MSDLISVIVPIFNTANFLPRCLNSLISQTYSNLEIILIDDGSSDSSVDICNQYARKDNRIKLFKKVNSGVSDTRNLGLENMNGKYFLFVDSDDYIHKDHIKILHSDIIRYNADMCISSYKKVSDNEMLDEILKFESRLYNKIDVMVNMITNKGYGWECVAKLFSRDVLGTLRFDSSERIGEDFVFSYKAVHNCKNIVINSMKSYYYIIRESSATKSGYTPSYDNLLDTANKFKIFIIDNYPNLIWLSSFFYIHSCIEILI
ncbi:glycosyltransferase family 2 protein, partial [Ursidibacter maritimus]